MGDMYLCVCVCVYVFRWSKYLLVVLEGRMGVSGYLGIFLHAV